jgi:hypothetical protein
MDAKRMGLMALGLGGTVAMFLNKQGKQAQLEAKSKDKLVASTPSWKQQGVNLNAAFDRMAALFLHEIESKYHFPPAAMARLKKLLRYTCVGGKCNRGALVLSTVSHVCARRGIPLTPERQEQALACGWAIEAMQACFLVADDIMDQSETRRGQPCWYKLPDVKYDAVNDSLILESFVFFLLKHFFGSDMATFCALNDLYREVDLRPNWVKCSTCCPNLRDAKTQLCSKTLRSIILPVSTLIRLRFTLSICLLRLVS